MQISNHRIAHMHGVAEWMYEHAEEYGCENREEMYLLGLLHDIGYLSGDAVYEQKGAELLGEDSYYGRVVKYHGQTPQEYMDIHGCSAAEIPNELILLWTADMTVDLNGNAVGVGARLKDIGNRYGAESQAYRKSQETMEWLANRKAIQTLAQNIAQT